MNKKKIYRTKEVAERAGVSKETLLRWLKEGKVKEPDRDRNDWRAFSDKDVRAIVKCNVPLYLSPLLPHCSS